MFGQTWNNGTLRKYVIFFGMLFSEVYLTREDSSDPNFKQKMQVPINYGPREKFLARADGDPNLDRPVSIQLPRMTYDMLDFQYAQDRKLSSMGNISYPNLSDPNSQQYFYNPIPYDLKFRLEIMVKNADDGTRIIEQIIPFFTPEWTGKLNLLDNVPSFDVVLVMDRVSHTDSYEGSFQDRRAIIWTLDFTMKAMLFGPVREGNIIKQAEVNFRLPSVSDIYSANTANSPTVVQINVSPGLTANGEPTSNSSLSIDKNLIKSTDNYGFIRDFMEDV